MNGPFQGQAPFSLLDGPSFPGAPNPEIRNLKLDASNPQSNLRFRISGFEMRESSNFKIPPYGRGSYTSRQQPLKSIERCHLVLLRIDSALIDASLIAIA